MIFTIKNASENKIKNASEMIFTVKFHGTLIFTIKMHYKLILHETIWPSLEDRQKTFPNCE